MPFNNALCFSIMGKKESAALNIAPPHIDFPGFLFQKLSFNLTSIDLKSSETSIILILLNMKGIQRLSILFNSEGLSSDEQYLFIKYLNGFIIKPFWTNICLLQQSRYKLQKVSKTLPFFAPQHVLQARQDLFLDHQG